MRCQSFLKLKFENKGIETKTKKSAAMTPRMERVDKESEAAASTTRVALLVVADIMNGRRDPFTVVDAFIPGRAEKTAARTK